MALAGVTLALAERWAAPVAGTVSGHCAGRANLWPLSAFPVHPFGRDAARVGIREQPPPSSVTRTLGRRLTQGHQASRRQSQARARPLSGLGLADWTLSSVSGVNTHRPASKRHTGAQPRRDPATSRALAFPSRGGRVLQGPGPPTPRQARGLPVQPGPMCRRAVRLRGDAPAVLVTVSQCRCLLRPSGHARCLTPGSARLGCGPGAGGRAPATHVSWGCRPRLPRDLLPPSAFQ